MPTPSPDWTMVTVHGVYTRLDGSPGKGRVIFTPRPLRFASIGQLTNIVGRAFVAPLNSSGAFTIQLPATDDPDIIPEEFSYNVREVWTGGREFDIVVPRATPSGGINIVTVAPLQNPLIGSYAPTTGLPEPSHDFEVDPAFAGLTVYFGPGPVPPPEDMPNTVYIVLPS